MRLTPRPIFLVPVLFALAAVFPASADVLAAGQNAPRRAAQAQSQDAPRKKAVRSSVRLTPVVTIAASALPAGEKFGEISDLAFDEQRALYVCDAGSADIKKFDAFGVYLRTIGRRGSKPGEFDRPGEIEIFGDRLYVRDLGRPKITLFDLDGVFVSAVALDEKEGEWRKFRVLPDGRFIVETLWTDPSNRNGPQETRLALHDARLARLKIIYRRPVRLGRARPFAPAVEWDVTTEGKIAAGFSGDYEIEILDPDKGRLISWKHPFKPVEVTEKDRNDYLAAAGSVQAAEFPKSKPAFSRFLVNGRDRIWVFFWPADAKAKPVFEAFDPDGSFRGRVICEDDWPASARFAFFQGGVWMSTSGPDGIKIGRYQITN